MKLKNPNYMKATNWIGGTHYGLSIRQGDKLVVTAGDSGDIVEFPTFIMDDGGVRVAPEGKLIIEVSGDRAPDWRSGAERKYGVGCRLASEWAKQLVCPHTKCVIPVSRIEDNPVVWVDYEFNVALPSGGISYEFPDGPPMPLPGVRYSKGRTKMFSYSFVNQKRYNEFIPRLRQIVAEADLRNSFVNEHRSGYESLTILKILIAHPEVTTIEEFAEVVPRPVNNGNMLTDEQEANHFRALSRGIVYVKPWDSERYEEIVKAECSDKYTSDYLEYHP
jgi:hypothetical protein